MGGQDECAICLDQVDDAVKLPCACRVVYCLKCWGHALAESFNGCGEARCPTCRSNVRVDFDAESCQLVFSPAQEMDDASSSDDNPDDDDDDDNTEDEDDQFGNVGKLERRKRRARRRLIRQACPAQIKLIQQHGASILAQTNGGVKETTQQAVAAIPCVCGGTIERISVRERIFRFVHRRLPALCPTSEDLDSVIRYFMRQEQPFASCDICGADVDTSSHTIWTCTAGSCTVLHSNAYDVCEGCVSRYSTVNDKAES